MSPVHQEVSNSEEQRPESGPKEKRRGLSPYSLLTQYSCQQAWSQHPSPVHTVSHTASLFWRLASWEWAQKDCQRETKHSFSAYAAAASSASGQPRLALSMPAPVRSPMLSAPRAMKEGDVELRWKKTLSFPFSAQSASPFCSTTPWFLSGGKGKRQVETGSHYIALVVLEFNM